MSMQNKTVPREEAACVICARLNWLENRIPVRLFACEKSQTPQAAIQTVAAVSMTHLILQSSHRKKNNIAKSLQLDKLFNVERYAERWPLIPKQELVHSAVKHPYHREMRWLLHTRRITMLENQICTDAAGIADPNATCLLCLDCLRDIFKKKPRMPKYALATDFWLGREHVDFKQLSDASRWLLSLARPVWKSIYLGANYGQPEPKQVGTANNCLFVARPNCVVLSKSLPPTSVALQDSLVVAFTGRGSSLKHAKWAEVSRSQYKKCMLIRRAVCPAFQDIQLDFDRVDAEFPEQGTPSIVENCCCQLDHCQKLSTVMPGCTSIPHIQGETMNEADAESSCPSEASSNENAAGNEGNDLITEQMIATNAESSDDALSCFAFFQKKVNLMQDAAKKIIENEKKTKLQRHDGTYASVPDFGGREVASNLLQELHQAAKSFTPAMQQDLEAAAAQLDAPVMPFTEALKIPTGAPLNAFEPPTWASGFTEFFYGDATPGLARYSCDVRGMVLLFARARRVGIQHARR